MPRCKREKDDNAIYHVTVRGNNKEAIFFNDDDKNRYLETLKRYKEKYKITFYGYCLMDNHIHLLIDSMGQDISKIMQGISLSYTIYINKTYDRCGHLFQDRFWSKIVDSEKYLVTASRYIHRNPVRAQIVKNEIDYKWSSINIYTGKKDSYKIVDEERILKCFGDNKNIARKEYLESFKLEDEEFELQIESYKYENSDKKVKVESSEMTSVIDKVALCFGIRVNDITLKNNRRYNDIRYLTQYLIRLKSKITYKEIGEKFGVCGSTIGQNINKAISIVSKNTKNRRYFDLILQS